VSPAARRLGVGRRLLAALEERAAAQGLRLLRLETGTRQPEAIRLYESSGYERIPSFGEYAADPFSVCYEKHLGA
jgi:putative acetyltransferase